jgi:YfiR/HmsC-like
MGLLSAARLRLLLGACLLWSTLALAAGPSEYEVKAVFLFNFSQFIAWPPEAFPTAQTPLVIGVLGRDPFGAALDEVVRGETIEGRRLEVRRYQRVEDIELCHILFVDRSKRGELDSILDHLRGRGVLTVGESANFARRGGIVQFVTMDKRIRLQINLDAAKTAGLTISSKLLRPAEIVATAK